MSLIKKKLSPPGSTDILCLQTSGDQVIAADGSTTFESHLTDTTSHAELADRTITVGVGKNFTTVQAAINSIKKNIESAIVIQLDAGTYNEDVTVKGFRGSGSLSILGAGALSDSYIIKSAYITNCGLLVKLQGVKANTTTLNAFTFENCINARGYFLKSDISALGQSGIVCKNGIYTMYGCLISNRAYALYVLEAATVASRDWTAGTGNTVGLNADLAATIGKTGTQPQGTTAEYSNGGAVIR